MSSMHDVCAVVVFHREGVLAIPALSSLFAMAARARSDGYKPQLVAMLDRADDETTSIVD
jgi:hypothetical protein